MSALPQPGQLWLDRYEIRDELGRGGFGRVYLANDRRLDREVAIKVLRQSDDFTDTDYQRFRREINIAARLTHPNVVTVYDGGDHDGLSYLVMRYVEGDDLRKELREGPLPLERLESVIEQIGGALDYAHGLGLVHRDVKPGNILCETGSDRVYLADFGISRPVEQSTEEQLTQAGLGPATFYYAAPEQLRTGQRVDARTDVYALGCVLYECLTATRPFEGKIGAVIGAHLHQPPPRPSVVRPDLSSGWDDVVARAMAKEPDQRYARCGDLAAAIVALAPGEGRATYVNERALAHTVATPTRHDGTPRRDDTPRSAAPPPPRTVTARQPAHEHPDYRRTGAGSSGPRFRATEMRPAQPPVRRRARRRSRARWTFVTLLAALAAMTAWLFWPDISAAFGAGTAPAAGEDDAPAPAPEEQFPSADQQRLLDTVGIFDAGDCTSPKRQHFEGVRTAVSCSNAQQTPTNVIYREFDDAAARDAAFEQQPGGRDATYDCRAGADGRHSYRNDDGEGQVLCVVAGGLAGMTWTVPESAIMGSAKLDGATTIDELSRWWHDAVQRDASDQLPDCPKDAGLIERGAMAAVQCPLSGGVATVASNAQFATVEEMDAWFQEVLDDARSQRLQEVREGGDPSVCTGLGVGDLRWVGGHAPWAIDADQGHVLCFVNESGLNAVFWTDATTAIGSVVVSPAATGPLELLVDEWTRAPYRVAD